MAGESKTAKRRTKKPPEAPKPTGPPERQPGKPPNPRPNAMFKPAADGSKAADPTRQDSFAPPGDPEFDRLVQALRQNRRRLLRLPGVVAVDVGYKIKKGVFLDELAIRVHVERKLPEKYFRDHQGELLSRSDGFGHRLPDKACFDPEGTLGTFDVIEAKYRAAASVLPRRGAVLETPLDPDEIDRRRRLDPLVGGISIGSPSSPDGTLGALVWDTTDGSICILSNWHVLAGHSQARPGDPCFQPGPFDRGRTTDVVARLKRWSFDRQTDAALAELTGSRHYCAGEIIGMPQQIAGETDPYLGMRVCKSGRSTGKTPGFVDGLYFSTAIQYSNGIMQTFEDQIHIAPVDPNDRISEPGDSGAIWVTDANGSGYLAVGLHFAGDLLRSAFGEYAVANPMTIVARNLGFSFRPRFLEIRDEDVLTLPETSGVELGNGNGNGNGGRPISLILSGLTGTGGQTGDPIQTPPGG
jgi:hypothetical protein